MKKVIWTREVEAQIVYVSVYDVATLGELNATGLHLFHLIYSQIVG